MPDDLGAIVEYAGDLDFARFAYHLRKGDFIVHEKFDKLGGTRFHLPREDYPALAKAASVVRTRIAEKSERDRQLVELCTDGGRQMGYTDCDLDEA